MTMDFEQTTARQDVAAEATVVVGQARTVDVTIIRPGESKNGMVYAEDVLRASMSMWEGATAFCDHPNLLDASRKGRSVRDVVGVYTKPRWDGAIKAHLRLLDE
ncbi:MAG: hypothetical protein HY783_02175, partial [Chloroflexi bacterium]|nr:hypothetical protein [Chloroflexota bacterium]